jgi:hypothetical protein
MVARKSREFNSRAKALSLTHGLAGLRSTRSARLDQIDQVLTL